MVNLLIVHVMFPDFLLSGDVLIAFFLLECICNDYGIFRLAVLFF